MPVVSDAPGTRVSGATTRRSALSDPKYWPKAVALDEVSVQIAVSRSGAPGARSSQALSASARDADG